MNKDSEITHLANQILQERLLLQKLSNQVYELMLQDLRIQCDRSRNYRMQ
ncbi:MAG TPA: hypothetical protein IGS40_19475 [Trichormus sp. M33_DOE_039]|nr:hypothetical protein [Trichormus sp. M33_DOE_039]